MALRRMFSLEVVNTDAFLDLPVSAQCLYFHLGMRADDDGFVASPKRITAMCGCEAQDLKALLDAGYLLLMPDNICVIRHWKINNYIQKDRYRSTRYMNALSSLSQTDNGEYFMDTKCIQLGYTLDTQDRIGKDRIEKERIEQERAECIPPDGALSLRGRMPRGRFGWVKLTEEEYDRLVSDLGDEEASRCIDYVDESAQATGNRNRWRDWNLVVRKCHREHWGLGNKRKKPAQADYDGEESFA